MNERNTVNKGFKDRDVGQPMVTASLLIPGVIAAGLATALAYMLHRRLAARLSKPEEIEALVAHATASAVQGQRVQAKAIEEILTSLLSTYREADIAWSQKIDTLQQATLEDLARQNEAISVLQSNGQTKNTEARLQTLETESTVAAETVADLSMHLERIQFQASNNVDESTIEALEERLSETAEQLADLKAAVALLAERQEDALAPILETLGKMQDQLAGYEQQSDRREFARVGVSDGSAKTAPNDEREDDWLHVPLDADVIELPAHGARTRSCHGLNKAYEQVSGKTRLSCES